MRETDDTFLRKRWVVGAWEASRRVPRLHPGLIYTTETKDSTGGEPRNPGSDLSMRSKTSSTQEAKGCFLKEPDSHGRIGEGTGLPPALVSL